MKKLLMFLGFMGNMMFSVSNLAAQNSTTFEEEVEVPVHQQLKNNSHHQTGYGSNERDFDTACYNVRRNITTNLNRVKRRDHSDHRSQEP